MEAVKSRFFRPYAQWIIVHRLVVAVVILGITAFLVTRMGNLQMDTNPDLWAPQKHVYVETTNLLDQIFGGKNYTVIGIVPKQGDVYQPNVVMQDTESASVARLSFAETSIFLVFCKRPRQTD